MSIGPQRNLANCEWTGRMDAGLISVYKVPKDETYNYILTGTIMTLTDDIMVVFMIKK